MAYATVSDLEARWRPLAQSEQAVASALLDDAAVLIDSHGEPKSDDAAKVVSCMAVRRSMSAAESDAFGVTQASMTAGSYQQQLTYANPGGDLYLTKQERAMLGFGCGKLGVAVPSYGRLEPDDD